MAWRKGRMDRIRLALGASGKRVLREGVGAACA
jgi:hypothetical protein